MDWHVSRVFQCYFRLPEGGTQVLKHVGVGTYLELYIMICILLYFVVCRVMHPHCVVNNQWNIYIIMQSNTAFNM